MTTAEPSTLDVKTDASMIEQVAASALAERYGTPLYVYSANTIRQAWESYDRALGDYPHLICYAVKANSNLAVLRLLAQMGSGFDIVSGGELARVLEAGGRADRSVFSGVGKRREEIEQALAAGIMCLNVESASELNRVGDVARAHGVIAPVSLRINPDVDAGTHPYISTGLRENKFGIEHGAALALYRQIADYPHLHATGIDCHIGSQLTEIEPYIEALDRLLDIVTQLKGAGIRLEHIDLGGGQGIRYRDESPIRPEHWTQQVLPRVAEHGLTLMLEPGRSIVGAAGVLLTRVEYLKQNGDKHFAVVDAGMNDLIRPPLYSAWQEIVETAPNADRPRQTYDVVGPVCETADFIGKQRELSIGEGDLLAVRDVGAYCAVMGSNYNSRPRAAEVMVDGDQHCLICRRETPRDLMLRELDLAHVE